MDARRVGSDGAQPDGVLNETLLQSLVADLGRAPVRSLIDLFLDDAPARIATLRAAVDGGDHDQAAKVAHLLKSAAGAVGASAFAARCTVIEDLAAGRSLDSLRREVETLPANLATAADALAAVTQ